MDKRSFQKFLLLWSGELISAIGSGITSFGLSVYVFNLTGSAASMTLVMLLAFLPALLLSPAAGVLADRYDRRFLMMLGDGFSALGLLFILFCHSNGGAQLWHICVGVTISSVFSALLEPAYKATVTDLLTPRQYTKASGLVGIAGSAKYLISPMIAGVLLAVSDIRLLLILDISTFFITAIATLVVKRGLVSKKAVVKASFWRELSGGFAAISKNKGVFALVVMGALITLFMGVLQTLSSPMILAFQGSATLGIAETICASGMLVSSVLIGSISIKQGYAKILSVSLFCAGVFMAVFGLRENVALICVAGFLFFFMLPFANTAIDYMLRTNIENELQGRAWGFVSIISQLGYVVAYGVAGLFADRIGAALNIGVGRGSALLIITAGVLLSITALVLYKIKSVKNLENGGGACIAKS